MNVGHVVNGQKIWVPQPPEFRSCWFVGDLSHSCGWVVCVRVKSTIMMGAEEWRVIRNLPPEELEYARFLVGLADVDAIVAHERSSFVVGEKVETVASIHRAARRGRRRA